MRVLTSARHFATAIGALALASHFFALGAQEPRRLVTPDSVPLELAAALVASGGFGAEPQILVGSMPEWVMSRLFLPPTARVLGAAFLGTTVVGVVSLPAASDSVLVELKRGLQQRGWTMPPPPPNYGGGGFRPAPSPLSEPSLVRLTLCNDQQTLTATAARRRGTTTNVTLRVFANATYSVCHPPQVQQAMMRSPFPTLFNPVGAADARMNGDCSSTLNGSSGTETLLRTSMTADSLLDHYGKQLADSGWTVSGARTSVVGRSWMRTDSSGAPIETLITVATPARDQGCRQLNMQVRTLRKP